MEVDVESEDPYKNGETIDVVYGYGEMVRSAREGVEYLVDGDGHPKLLPINENATKFYPGSIVGDVVFMRLSSDRETVLDLTEDDIIWIKEVIG